MFVLANLVSLLPPSDGYLAKHILSLQEQDLPVNRGSVCFDSFLFEILLDIGEGKWNGTCRKNINDGLASPGETESLGPQLFHNLFVFDPGFVKHTLILMQHYCICQSKAFRQVRTRWIHI